MKTIAIILLLITLSTSANAENKSIVHYAQREIGRGEEGCNNCGQWVKMYTRGEEASWCAGYVSHVLREAGISIPYHILVARAFLNLGDRVNKPESGDLIIFWRGKDKYSWQGHVGIVEKVEGNTVHTIEGNVGAYPAKVKRLTYTLGEEPKLLAYVRVK